MPRRAGYGCSRRRTGLSADGAFWADTDEDLGVVHNARAGFDDCNPLARIIDEHLIAGHMMLAHHRRKIGMRTKPLPTRR
jgi:hypothetical protein